MEIRRPLEVPNNLMLIVHYVDSLYTGIVNNIVKIAECNKRDSVTYVLQSASYIVFSQLLAKSNLLHENNFEFVISKWE